MLLIMMILLSVSVSLFVVENNTMKYAVVTVLGRSIAVSVRRNMVLALQTILNQGAHVKIEIDFRGPPKYII